MSRIRHLAVALFPLYLGGCASGPSRLVTLGDSIEPVRSTFNADRDKPRVVAVFSPT
ncbi:MAG TPA: hypothetical protein VJZ71_19560 [Phycisphaerae bacterium]|nr:hypothetical protein [Phycisphaerae bacterium]